MRGASVEMITNAIAEMCTYGEGFLIADQSPSIMDRSVIANTQTKVFFMLPEREDRAVAASSLELNMEQQSELARLPIGAAVAYQNAWAEPVLTKIRHFDKAFMKAYIHSPRNIVEENKELFGQAFAILLNRRIITDGHISTYDNVKIESLIKNDYYWLGDIESECKRILEDRMRITQTKEAASKIASLYSCVLDFEKQLSLLNEKKSIEIWLSVIKQQILKVMKLNDDEVNELIGVLLFDRRTKNSGALKLHSEYQKLIMKKRGEETLYE